VLDQRRQALDPVAVVAVEDAVDLAHLGVVDVAADHAMRAAAARFACDGDLEVVDVADRALDLVLQVARKAPVRQPDPGPRDVEPAVDLEREFIGLVTHIGQPLRALDDAVEQVAVRDPQPPAVGCDVHAVFDDLDAAEGMRDVAARELVVVAGHEDHPGALAGAPQQLLHHVVVGLRPIPRAAQLPAIDDVANEVQRLALHFAQELQQRPGLATRCAQVQVRDPHRAHVQPADGSVVVGVHEFRVRQHGTRAWHRLMTRA